MNKSQINFEWQIYLNNYSDLRAAGINTQHKAYMHWMQHGKKEGRVANKIIKNNNDKFDWIIYIHNYSDIYEAGINTYDKAKSHWINCGIKEGRIADREINSEVTNVKICVGIGDILIYIYTYHQLGLLHKVRFILDKNFIKFYRKNYLDYLEFIKKIFGKYGAKCLVVNESDDLYPIVTTDKLITRYNINFYTSLNDYRSRLSLENKFSDKYVIIHTKFRTTYLPNILKENKIKEYIKNLFSNFKSKFPIVLLGEKDIEPIIETTVIGIYSIYNELLTSLEKNNIIIDCTVSNLQQNYDFDLFTKDISIIHNAEYNVIFGTGGNLVMSIMFAKKFIALVADYDHPMFQTASHGIICRTNEEMTKEILEINQ